MGNGGREAQALLRDLYLRQYDGGAKRDSVCHMIAGGDAGYGRAIRCMVERLGQPVYGHDSMHICLDRGVVRGQ
jgi:hypothetical protein